MRDLTSAEESALSEIQHHFQEVAVLHVGERAANIRQMNMDATIPVAELWARSGIHDYGGQAVGEEYKRLTECVIFDGQKTELSPLSFNRARSRSRKRFWIPALRRMAEKDDVLAFVQDAGLPIVLNLSGIARYDPDLSELRALIAKSGSTPATRARQVAESPEMLPSQVGYEPSSAERAAMEEYSRRLATSHFEDLGWAVKPTSGSIPYDLIAERGGEVLYVEVKSSKGPAEMVILTHREVAHAQEAPMSALFIASDVIVRTTPNGGVEVSGGRRRIVLPWKPAEHDLFPLDYRYTVPAAESLD